MSEPEEYDYLAPANAADRPSVPAHASETTCEKCGSDDILIRWHEKRPSNRRASCRDSMSVLDYGRLPESKDEHLHYHCRRCQFIWIGPVGRPQGGRDE